MNILENSKRTLGKAERFARRQAAPIAVAAGLLSAGTLEAGCSVFQGAPVPEPTKTSTPINPDIANAIQTGAARALKEIAVNGTPIVPAGATGESTPVPQKEAQLFSVNGKEVGGPVNQWWPLQDADGKVVPDSWKFVGMRTTDSNLPGWDMNIPEGMLAFVWVDKAGQKQAYEVMGGQGAKISGPYKVAEMSLYTRPIDYDASKAGQWAKIDNANKPVSNWVKIGTEPMAAEAAAPAAQSSSGRCTATDANGKDVPTSPIEGGQKYLGKVEDLKLGEGMTAIFWDGKTTQHVTGPATIHTGEASLYCTK